MSTQAVNVVVTARDKASKKFARIGKSATGMGGMIRKAAAMAAVYLGGRAIKNFLASSVEAAGRQEMAVKGLSDALELLGKNNSRAIESARNFAAEMQSITISGDEAILEVMTLGATMGKLSGEQLQDATKAAIGLGKAFKMDTAMAMRLVAKAAQGNTDTLTRYGIVLDSTLSTEEKFQKVLELGVSQFKLAIGETDTYRGAIQQMKNAVGDLKEKIGDALIPTIVSSAKKIKKWAEDNQKNVGEWAKKAMSHVELAKDVFMSFVDYMKTDWQDGLKYAFNSFATIVADLFVGVASLAYKSGKSALDAWLAGWFGDASFEEYFKYSMSGAVQEFKTGMADTFNKIKEDMPKDLGKSVDEAFAKHKTRLAAIAAPSEIESPFARFRKENMPTLKMGGDDVQKTGDLAGLMPKVGAQESRFLTLSTQRRYEADIAKTSKQASDKLTVANKTLKDIGDGIKTIAAGASPFSAFGMSSM